MFLWGTTVNIYIRSQLISCIQDQWWMQCLMCTASHVRRGVMITPYCANAELSLQFFWRDRSESSVAGDVCGGKGCVTGLVPENPSQPLPPEPAETPPEGHDTQRSLFPPLHQAFHMSQPSLTSPPGWRKKRKRMLYCFSSCFTSPWVTDCCLFLFLFSSLCVVKTSCLALIWLIL